MKKKTVNGKTVYYLDKKKDKIKVTLELQKVSYVGREEIKRLLDEKSTVFIVDTHLGIRLVEGRDVYDFWKKEVQIRLVAADEDCEEFSIDDYSDGYCYVAIKCRNIKDSNDTNNYILLDMYH